ncbi:MAG: hypothetical protein ACK4YP_13325 [Myxococcota bacterium]
MPDRRDKPNPLPQTPVEVPERPTTAPERTPPATTPGTPAPQGPTPETGTPTPPMPEPPAPWLKERPDRKRGTGEPGRRREDQIDQQHPPDGPRRG